MNIKGSFIYIYYIFIIFLYIFLYHCSQNGGVMGGIVWQICDNIQKIQTTLYIKLWGLDGLHWNIPRNNTLIKYNIYIYINKFV